MRAGLGVISRLPLEHNGWQRLPKARAVSLQAALFAPHETVQVVDVRCGVRGVRLMQAHLAPRRADWYQRQDGELAAIVRRVAMPGCVMTGIDEPAVEGIRAGLGAPSGLRLETGGVLLGSSWVGAEVGILPPVTGVSEHAPVLVTLPL